MLMEQTMRWFGPNDPVSLQDIRQAGCAGVVTALHHIPVGEVWTVEEIQKRKKEVEAAGMRWTVIESLPVHEDIKKQTGGFEGYIRNYLAKSAQQLSAMRSGGRDVISCRYWIDDADGYLRYEMPDKSRALLFERARLLSPLIFFC